MNLQYPHVDLLSDGHVHTHLCNHATGEMEEYVQSAIRKGLREIIFLEHLEAGISYSPRTWLERDDFEEYLAEGDRLRRKYADIIVVGTGVEVGYNPQCSQELLSRLAEKQWARIGISCHFLKLPGTGEYLNLLSRKPENMTTARKAGPQSLLTAYFANLTEAVQTLPGDVLCHLDAALRFLPELEYTQAHLDQVQLLLDRVKERGMAVEINCSGLSIRSEPFPGSIFLKMVLEREIPLVAGSDAHRPEDVAKGFEQIPQFITS